MDFIQKVLDRYNQKAKQKSFKPDVPTSLRDFKPPVYANQRPQPSWMTPALAGQPRMTTKPPDTLIGRLGGFLQDKFPTLHSKVQRGKEIKYNIESAIQNIEDIRKPYGLEGDTFKAPGASLGKYTEVRLKALTSVLARVPEIIPSIIVGATDFFRKNIATLKAGKPVETIPLQNILGMSTERLGVDQTKPLQDTIEAGLNQLEIEIAKNPNKSDFHNALVASSKTILPDVLDVLLAANVAQGVVKLGQKGIQASAKQLPDSILFKIQKKQVSPQALLDSLIHGKPTLSNAKDFQIADTFIKSLTTQEKKSLFNLARSYETMGLPITLPGQATPTLLGKIAGTTPRTVLPPRISGLLPGGASSPQAGFINPEAISKDLTSLAKKATNLKTFEKVISKEHAALLTARGLTSIDFFNAVKTPTLPPLTQEVPKLDTSIPNITNKVSLQDIPAIKQNPPEYIAMRTMRDGTKKPAIRQTGIFAPKEFETHIGKDISGILGGQSWNLRDALISWDNVDRVGMAKTGQLGPGEKLQYQGKETDANILEFGNKKAQDVRDIAKQYNLNLSNPKTDIQITLSLHGLTNGDIQAKGAKQAIIDTLRNAQISEEAIKQALKPGLGQAIKGKDSVLVEAVKNGIPVSVTNAVSQGFRPHLETLRTEANIVRTSMGKTPIQKRDHYGPVLQQTSFYSQMRTKPKTEITDNFDYIIPNAKKNPHALARNAGAENLEWRASNLLTRYHESIARDIYDAPFIEQLKAVNSVLKPKYPKTSKLIEKHIREQRVGKPALFDAALGINEGTIKRAALNKINTARTIQALSGNIVWVVFIQPASQILTLAKAGPINLTKGLLKFSTSPKERAYVNKLPTMITKTKGLSVGSTGAGDLDQLGNRIVKGKLETINDFVGKIADAHEYWLTGTAMIAGKEKAIKLGLKGSNVDMYADWMGGSTQSEYIRNARPMISNNILVRTSFPFTTYAFELYRYSKTLVGLPGGRKLSSLERINQIILLLSGMYVADACLDKAIGRRLSTSTIDVGDIPNIPVVTSEGDLVVPRVATWIPIGSDVVDDLVNRAYNVVGIQQTDSFADPSGRRAAGALHRDIQNFIGSIDTYIRHNNIQPLRKELLKWGMGIIGIAGAATINRLVDGLIATAQGFQTDKSGNRLFRIEGIDRYLSPLLGPYSTRAGIEFIKSGNSIIVQDATKEKKRLESLPIEEAKKEFDVIMQQNPKLARMINQLIEDDRNPNVKALRGLPNDMKAEKLVDIFENIPENERVVEYQKLIDAGVVTQDVTNKYLNLLEKQSEAVIGNIPDLADGVERSDKSIIKIIGLYAKAIGSNPIDAFSKIFAGEKIRRIDNGAIIVERMPFEESQKVRSDRATSSELKNLRLDHLIPLQLGGTNRDDNLILVTIDEHAAYTPIENLLGDHLRNGRINPKEAQKLIKEFKEGQISAEEILQKYPPKGQDESNLPKNNESSETSVDEDIRNYDLSLRNIIQ
jgi:hypothetical protein